VSVLSGGTKPQWCCTVRKWAWTIDDLNVGTDGAAMQNERIDGDSKVLVSMRT
jgi:hypothetical protein